MMSSLICCIVIFSQTFGHLINNYFSRGNQTTGCGYIMSTSNPARLLSCSEVCLKHETCKGFLFNQEVEVSDRCKLITSQSTKRVNKTFIENQYVEYSARVTTSHACNDLGISIGTPADWQSWCPTLYFPLDSMTEGTAVGPHSANIVFLPGKVNNSFYFNNPMGTHQAYFNLGSYPATSYCFPEPQRCPKGVSYAFWMKLLGIPTGTNQGFFSTATKNGPGLVVNWQGSSYDRLAIRIKRDSDTKRDWIRLSRDDFMQEYGFGNWVHYVITYKYVAGSGKNDLEVYFNGEIQEKVQKKMSNWMYANTEDYNGNLQLGSAYVSNYDTTGNMAFDDLIIWEEQLPCDDVFRLYQAYKVLAP